MGEMGSVEDKSAHFSPPAKGCFGCAAQALLGVTDLFLANEEVPVTSISTTCSQFVDFIYYGISYVTADLVTVSLQYSTTRFL